MTYLLTRRCVWCLPPHIMGYKAGGADSGQKTDGMCPRAVKEWRSRKTEKVRNQKGPGRVK